ncbi:MAG: leucine-rich repeat domain-containing protein [Oscillospiraceae bacterium]|nr:leucine-rich repeat domain-containing protein [Oscillospiraceae bacterium]
MAFSYGFFDSKNLDRVYTAEDFTSYLSGMICDGVFDTYGDNFSVSAGDNVSVVIGTGKAWIDGHFFLNDIAYKLDLKKYVDESLNRYVIIGISCDTSDSVRACQIEVKAGTAATSPSVPSFQNTDAKKYLTLAAVRLNNGITEISQADITDYRSNEKKCGYVKCILGKCKVSEILSALDTYNSTITQLNNHVTELQNRLAEVEAVTGATGVILVSAGQIGSNAFYALYSDGTLRINGSGSTYSYTGLNNSIFYMNSNIKKIIVSSGITALGDFLFESCDNIKTVSLASTVTSIGASAFSSTGLEEITIPASVKSIGEYAFKGTKLTNITIPESVTSMGYYIFSSCMKLKTVKINGSVISSYTFAFCYALSSLTISVNCKSIGSNIIAYCQYLDTINYEGTIAQWNSIQKPDNWISSADHNYNGYLKKIQCSNGYLEYDTVNYTWKEVKN